MFLIYKGAWGLNKGKLYNLYYAKFTYYDKNNYRVPKIKKNVSSKAAWSFYFILERYRSGLWFSFRYLLCSTLLQVLGQPLLVSSSESNRNRSGQRWEGKTVVYSSSIELWILLKLKYYQTCIQFIVTTNFLPQLMCF